MILDCYRPTFARKFVAASTQYMRCSNGATLVSSPLTMACWFSKVETNASRTLLSIGSSIDTAMWQSLNATNTAVIQAASRAGGSVAGASTTATYSADRWHHAAAVFASTTSRTPYLDGEPGSTDTLTRNPTNPNTVLVGATDSGGTISAHHNGLIAWPAYWNVALSHQQIRRLAQGHHPTTVQPENLFAFYDFDGRNTELDIKSALPLTNFNNTTPLSAAPGFLRTRIPRPWLLGAGEVPIVTSKPWHYYQQMRAA